MTGRPRALKRPESMKHPVEIKVRLPLDLYNRLAEHTRNGGMAAYVRELLEDALPMLEAKPRKGKRK